MKKALLKQIARIQVAYQSRKKIQEVKNGTHRLIQSRDFDENYQLRTDTLIRFDPDRKPEYYLIKRNDILFQARGMEHFVYQVQEEMKNTMPSNSFYIIRLNSGEINPGFLCWYLDQKPAQLYFRSQAGKTVISFVSKRTLEQLEIQIPSLNIQQKVVKVSDLWKREQSLNNKLTETRLRLMQAISMNAIQSEGDA